MRIAEGPNRKFCPKCNDTLPVTEFYTTRQRNGRVYARDLCKTHDKERATAWQQRNREKARANWRASHERRKADPERMAVIRDRARELKRRKFNIDPARYRRRDGADSVTGVVLPCAPFAAWLRMMLECDGASIQDLATRFDVADRTLRAVLNGHREGVELATVERALIADDTLTLRELYPTLFEERAA